MLNLYFVPSTASMVPHILLEELGVPFQLTRVDRENNAHKAVVVKLFVAKRDQLKGVFWALVRPPVCLG